MNSRHPSKRLAWVAVSIPAAVLLLIAGKQALVDREVKPERVSGSGIGLSHPGSESEQGGIGLRASSPSNAVVDWLAPSVSKEDLLNAKQIDLSRYYESPGAVPFEDIEPLVGWVDAAATDDEFGRKVAACRYRYERVAARQACEWEETITVQQQGDDVRVAGVSPDVDQSVRPECAGFVRCMQNAWKGRDAPRLIQGDGVYRVSSTVRLPKFDDGFGDWTDGEYAQAYEAEIQRKSELLDKRAAYMEEARATGEWDDWPAARQDSFLHNQAQSAARLIDCQMMLAEIRANAPG